MNNIISLSEFLWRLNLMRQFVPTLSTVASIQKMVTVGMLLCNFPKVTQLENDWVTTQTQVLQNKKVNKIRTDTHIHSMLQKLQNEDHTPLPQTPLSTKLYIYIYSYIHTYGGWQDEFYMEKGEVLLSVKF